jgi:hypothetical protein
MTAFEAASKVVADKQCVLLRPRKGEPLQYDVKDAFCGRKRGWFYLDLFTSSVISQVYSAVNEQNKAKLANMPIQKIARICFQVSR